MNPPPRAVTDITENQLKVLIIGLSKSSTGKGSLSLSPLVLYYTVKTLVLNKHQTGFITGPIWNGVNLTPLRCYFNTFRYCFITLQCYFNSVEKCLNTFLVTPQWC